MNKKPRKSLRLTRETLRRLEAREIERAFGGTEVDDPPTETCWCVTYDPCLEQ